MKAESFVGGGAMLGMYDGKRIELVRYTNARSARFMTATHLLEKWMKGEEAERPRTRRSTARAAGCHWR